MICLRPNLLAWLFLSLALAVGCGPPVEKVAKTSRIPGAMPVRGCRQTGRAAPSAVWELGTAGTPLLPSWQLLRGRRT